MSLVGSSVRVGATAENGPILPTLSTDSREDGGASEDMATALEDDDLHPPPTPPGGMEALFLSGLPTQNISASALAQQIHIRHRPLSLAGTSIATDDFVSAAEVLPPRSPFSMLGNDEYADDQIDDQPFGNDALIHTRQALFEQEEETDNMASTTPSKPLENLDPAEKIYGTAKGVWGWGKGIIIFSPFMGIAEGIAGKIVETAGSNLEDLDTAVLDKLHSLDDGILNPAISTIVSTVIGAKDTTVSFVTPIVVKVLSPFGLLKDKPEAESTVKPDGTTPMVAAK